VEEFQQYIDDGFLDESCPPETPFRQDKAHMDKWFGGQGYSGGCVEKPQDQTGGGGRGGGGGGGGRGGGQGSGSTTASSLPGGQDGISGTIWDQIRGDLEGGPSRYSPENMAAIEADQFARVRRQEQLQLEESRRDAAMRGGGGSISRSGGQAAALRGIRSGTGQQILANRSNIAQAKIDADYQDRQAAIKNAQNYLNSLRQYMLQSDMNSIQREQLSAQIAMANKQLSWQTRENDRQHGRNLEYGSIFDPNSPMA